MRAGVARQREGLFRPRLARTSWLCALRWHRFHECRHQHWLCKFDSSKSFEANTLFQTQFLGHIWTFSSQIYAFFLSWRAFTHFLKFLQKNPQHNFIKTRGGREGSTTVYKLYKKKQTFSYRMASEYTLCNKGIKRKIISMFQPSAWKPAHQLCHWWCPWGQNTFATFDSHSHHSSFFYQRGVLKTSQECQTALTSRYIHSRKKSGIP